MAAIRLAGWQTGLNKVALTKILQEEADYGLADAKGVVDRILAGSAEEVEVADGEAAERLARRALEGGITTADLV